MVHHVLGLLIAVALLAGCRSRQHRPEEQPLMPVTVMGPTPTPMEPEAPPVAPRVEDNPDRGSGWYPTGRYRRSYSRGYRRRR